MQSFSNYLCASAANCTKGSHDQGVDVVAQKNGTRIVLRCKLYNQPVGTKAVQEAFTAKAYEQAHLAAVVSSSAYTVSARQLAKSRGVLLLHCSELRNMDVLAGQAYLISAIDRR